MKQKLSIQEKVSLGNAKVAYKKLCKNRDAFNHSASAIIKEILSYDVPNWGGFVLNKIKVF